MSEASSASLFAHIDERECCQDQSYNWFIAIVAMLRESDWSY